MRLAFVFAVGCGMALGLNTGLLRAQGEDKPQAEQKLNEAWDQLSTEDKMTLMRFHHAMRDLPPEQRKAVRERIGRLLSMSPAERERLEENLKRWQQMTPQERQKAREEFRRRKQALEEKWHREHPGEEPPPPKN